MLRNIPNFLTALRLAAAPALVMLLLQGHNKEALAVFVIAGLTDAADGWLAKRFGFATTFGRYLDPAADKLLMLTSFLVLTYLHVMPLWLTVLVIVRDAAIVLGILVARLWEMPVRAAPSLLGKISTAVQVIYVALMLVTITFMIDIPALMRLGEFVTAVFTLASGLGYAQIWLRAAFHRRGSLV
jgi:cardiolipin synthase